MWWSSCVPVGCWAVCSSGLIRVGLVITGTGGLLPALLEEWPLERGLAAELTGHLGLWEGPGRFRWRVPARGSGSAAKDCRPRRWGPPGPVAPMVLGGLARRRGGQRKGGVVPARAGQDRGDPSA